MRDDVLEALLDTITPMGEEMPYYRVMLYGESGGGKTKLACEFGHKILYIESDPYGWVTLLNHPELKAKCTRMVYAGLSQIEAVCEAYEEGIETFTKHDLIVVDTLSAIATLDLDVVVGAARRAYDKDVPTWPDMNATTEHMRRVLMRLIALPVNIVFTSHVREDADGPSGKLLTRPNFMPKLRKDVERLCTLVGYMTADATDEGYERLIQVHPTRNVNAKSRIGGLPVIMSPDDLPPAVEAWLESGRPIVEDTVIHPESAGLNPTVTVETKTDEPQIGLDIS